MSAFFEPLDSDHRVLPRQQTRVAAFLMSAHGALARQYALTLPAKFVSAWQVELNAQTFHETEIVSLLLRATSWEPDLALGPMAMSWELAWLPMPVEEIQNPALAMAAGLATLAHAIHAGIRPAALLPADASATDPFVMALRRVEFESGHLLQAQILLLKSADLVPFRGAVSAALEYRHAQVSRLWRNALAGIGITVASRND